MKKSGKNILYFVIILLVIAVAILAGVIINNSNSTISKQEEGKTAQLTETSSDNAYVDMGTHLEEVSNSASGEMTCLGVVKAGWNAGTTSGNKSYTVEEDGEYIFLIFNSAYKTTSANAKITLNGTELSLTYLVGQRPLYDSGWIYRTDLISCKQGDVIKSVFKNSNEPDWNAYTTIIIFKS